MDAYRQTLERILRYQHNGIVAGGYALEFYTNRYGVGIDANHPAATRDLDILGSSNEARQLLLVLGPNTDIASTRTPSSPSFFGQPLGLLEPITPKG